MWWTRSSGDAGGRHTVSRVIGRLGGGWRGRVGDATDGRGWWGVSPLLTCCDPPSVTDSGQSIRDGSP
jgi:hypothetical protein